MKKEKYLPLKPGSIQAIVAEMQMKEQELVEVKGNELEKMIQDYLRKGGTIKKLPPVLAKGMKPSEMKPHEIGKMGIIKSMKMKEVREFVDTYNKHFLLNYKAEELVEKKSMTEVKDVVLDFRGSHGNYIDPNDAFAVQQSMKNMGIRFKKIDRYDHSLVVRGTNDNESKMLDAIKKVPQYRNAKVDASVVGN